MLRKTIARQCEQVFECLLGSLQNCPEASFGLHETGETKSIGRIAMHIGASIENAFMTPEFRQRWNTPVSSKNECIDYLRSCKVDLIQKYVESNELLEPDPEPQYFISKLDRAMKMLRHVSHHTGEIAGALDRLGLQAGKFV